jgi:hypothetical protein
LEKDAEGRGRIKEEVGDLMIVEIAAKVSVPTPSPDQWGTNRSIEIIGFTLKI